jgi:hypothetical protein
LITTKYLQIINMSLFKIYNPIEDVIAKVNSGAGGGGVPSTGGTFTGDIIMAPPAKVTQSTPPTGPSDLVNLGYLQSNYLPLVGGTLTGNMVMSGTTEIIQCTLPTTNCSLSNKQYVDAQVANATVPDATTLAKGKIQLAGDLGGVGTSAVTPTISNQAVTNIKLANFVGNSKLKGSSNTSANATDISLGSNLIMNGTTLDVNPTSVPTIPVPVSQGGTGVTTLPAKYVVSNGTAPFSSVASIPVADVLGAVLTVNGVAPVAGNVTVVIGNVSTGQYGGGPPSPPFPPSPAEGDIYIINGDPTPANNGRSFIYDANTTSWLEFTINQASTDLRYLLRTTDTFTAPGTLTFPTTSKIILADNAVNGTDAMNLNTFNNLKAGQSRFGVIEFSPTGDLTDLGGPSANSGIAVVKPASIGVAKLNLSGASRVFGSNNTNNNVTELTMGSGIEITSGGVLQANLSGGVITNTLVSNTNNISSNVAGTVANLTISPGTISQVVGLNAGGVLVQAAGSSLPLSNNLTSNENVISSNVAGNQSNLTIAPGTLSQLVGLDGSGVLVRALNSALSLPNNLTSSGNSVTSNVAGNASVLTIAPGTLSQLVGLDGSGVLIRASATSSTTNSLVGGSNCIVSNVNGVVSNLTPAPGTVNQAIGFDAGGVLVKGPVTTTTTNVLTTSTNTIVSNVNGVAATLTPAPGVINQLLGFDIGGSLVGGNSSTALQKANATAYGVVKLDTTLGSDLVVGTSDGIAKIRPTASNGQLLGSNTTSTTVQNITLGPSLTLNPSGSILSAQISFFNGTNPSITDPTDRPTTSGVLYYGVDASTWYYNGSNYVTNNGGGMPFTSGVVPANTSVTLDTISAQWYPTDNIFRLKCSSPGGILATLIGHSDDAGSLSPSGAGVRNNNYGATKAYTSFDYIPSLTSGNADPNIVPGIQWIHVFDYVTLKVYLLLLKGPVSLPVENSYIAIKRLW